MRTPGYFTGKTPSFACQADPRFSYCLYVPRQAPVRSMLVAVHDTLRNNQALRDAFAEHAEASGTLVLAPLFPAGIGSPHDLDDYKYLHSGGVRYDEVLMAMVDEVASRHAVDAARFALFGFSGGAHFAHRLLYLRPERLAALVIAAPGSVTLPDARLRWWAGLADFETRFGRPVDWDALRQVPVHLVVGAADTDPAGTIGSPDHPLWVEGADTAGANRVERLHTLHSQLLALQCKATLETLPGVGHVVDPAVAAAIRFFGAHSWRDGPQP
jgi:poly(3-hydroxybutyrate) depolymerase